MRHSAIDNWSRRSSPLHHWDARLKLLLLLVYLVTLSFQRSLPRAAILLVPLAAALVIGRLPLRGILQRAAFVLPFTLAFALVAWGMGDAERAVLLLGKSYLSALAVTTLAASTPFPALMGAAEWLRAPRALVWIIQLVYRYFFVIFEKGTRMRQASESRAGGLRQLLSRAGTGLFAVLFAGSHQQAAGVHRAMLARGYQGHVPMLAPRQFGRFDWPVFAACAVVIAILPLIGIVD